MNYSDVIEMVVSAIGLLLLSCIILIISIVILVTLYALVKPYIIGIFMRWFNWVFKRIEKADCFEGNDGDE